MVLVNGNFADQSENPVSGGIIASSLSEPFIAITDETGHFELPAGSPETSPLVLGISSSDTIQQSVTQTQEIGITSIDIPPIPQGGSLTDLVSKVTVNIVVDELDIESSPDPPCECHCEPPTSPRITLNDDDISTIMLIHGERVKVNLSGSVSTELVNAIWTGSISIPMQVNYYTDDPGIAAVGSNTGILTAKSEGNTKLRCETMMIKLQNCCGTWVPCPEFDESYKLTAIPIEVEVLPEDWQVRITNISPTDESATANLKPTVSATIEVPRKDIEVKAIMRIRPRDIDDVQYEEIVVEKTFIGKEKYVLEQTLDNEDKPLTRYMVEVQASTLEDYTYKEWAFCVFKKHTLVKSEGNSEYMRIMHPLGENFLYDTYSNEFPDSFKWGCASACMNGEDDSGSHVDIYFWGLDGNEKVPMKYNVSMTFSYHLVVSGSTDNPPIAYVGFWPSLVKEMDPEPFFEVHENLRELGEIENTITKDFQITLNEESGWFRIDMIAMSNCSGKETVGSSIALVKLERLSMTPVE